MHRKQHTVLTLYACTWWSSFVLYRGSVFWHRPVKGPWVGKGWLEGVSSDLLITHPRLSKSLEVILLGAWQSKWVIVKKRLPWVIELCGLERRAGCLAEEKWRSWQGKEGCTPAGGECVPKLHHENIIRQHHIQGENNRMWTEVETRKQCGVYLLRGANYSKFCAMLCMLEWLNSQAV